MKLADWLEIKQIRPSHFAEKVGVSPSTITRIVKGTRQASADLVNRIERETAGEVTFRDLFVGRVAA